jgi:hypothetical protein
MCENGGHEARRALPRDSLSTGTGKDPARRVSEGRAQRKNFFNGTKLPISLKTKGRGGRLRGTKLPFAPSAGARKEEAGLVLLRSFSVTLLSGRLAGSGRTGDPAADARVRMPLQAGWAHRRRGR